MSKRPASLLVIGAFPEDDRMYPHLHDILENLRSEYDEVVYLGNDPQYLPLLEIDRLLEQLPVSAQQAQVLAAVKEKIRASQSIHAAFVKQMADTRFRNARRLVLAIDDNAFNCAIEAFPESTVYWSFDPLGRDCPYRLNVNGFVEKMLHQNALKAPQALALIVQDRDREQHLLDCLGGGSFRKTLYVPVSLNDNDFCREAARKRAARGALAGLRVVQSGHICAGRYSDELARAFRGWPSNYELHCRGNVGREILAELQKGPNAAHISDEFVDNATLPAILDRCDCGFIGYRETDRNHHLIVNASSQLAGYLRLGMPVLCCGSDQLIAFVNDNRIGVAARRPSELERRHLDRMAAEYSTMSRNARRLFEARYDLKVHMGEAFYGNLDALMKNEKPQDERTGI